MIFLQFNIRNPWSDRFVNIGCWHGNTFIKNKFWEIQIYKGSDIVDIFLRLTHRQSHAGLHLGVGLFGINIEFQIYDNRHWDHETKSWEIH
jgi:hypothetical protein